MRRARIVLAISLLVSIVAACAPAREPQQPTKAAAEPTSAPVASPTVTQTAAPTASPVPTNLVTSMEDVKHATVQIEAQGSFVDPELGALTNVAGRGTGFIIDPSGIAVTNNHVVTGSALLKVWVGGDTQPKSARILGVSECWDLAVIDIEGDGYPYMEMRQGEVEPGLEVYAAGFPLGDPEYTLTKGIVSKAKASGNTSWASVSAVLEHDARIRPGNSGGPLVDKEGKVVGVNYAGNDVYDQNFAIRIKDAQKVIDTLKDGKDFEANGINGQAVMSEDKTISGVWVSSVESGSPADKAGIKGGDILTKMEGLVLGTDGTLADYCGILRTHNMQDTLGIEVLRFATKEVMAGQFNGKALETSFSFANELSGQVPEAGAATGSAEYSQFVKVTDNSGSIEVSIPAEWSDLNGDPWETGGDVIGASITAAASLQRFNEGYDEPGVFFGVSDDVAKLVGYAQLLDSYRETFRKDCKYEGRQQYKDSAFEGAYDLFSKCGGSADTLIVLSVRPQQGKTSFLVNVLVNMKSEADAAALDEILRTFDVVGQLP